MIEAVVVVSLGSGNMLMKENKVKSSISETESQEVNNELRLSSSKGEIEGHISSENQIQNIFNTCKNIDNIQDIFYLENYLLLKENTKINPKDVIELHFPYDVNYNEDTDTFRIGKKGNCQSVDYILVSSFMNMYECSLNKTDIIISIPSYYYSSIVIKNKIKSVIELCDYRSVNVISDYEAIALSYAYSNREEIKDTENLMILQIDSISTSSTIIQVNTEKCKILSNSYDGYLGDRLIDKMIYDYINDKLMKDEKIQLNDQTKEFKISLMEKIRCLKYELCNKETIDVVVEDLNGKDFTFYISNNKLDEFAKSELKYSFSPSNYENKSIYNTIESRLSSIIKDSIIKSELKEKEMKVVLVGKFLSLKPFKTIIQTCLSEIGVNYSILDYNSNINECNGCYYKSLINNNIWKYEIENYIIPESEDNNNNDNQYNQYIKQLIEKYKDSKKQNEKYKNELKELISTYHDIFMCVYRINDRDNNNNDRQYKHKIMHLFCNEKKILSSNDLDSKKVESYKCLINKGLEEIKEEYKDIIIEEITKYKEKSEELIRRGKLNEKNREKVETLTNEIQEQIHAEKDILKLQELNNKIESMLFICEETIKEIENYNKQICIFDSLFKELKSITYELQSFNNLIEYIQYSNEIHTFSISDNYENEEEEPPAIVLKNKSAEIEQENERMKILIIVIQTSIKQFEKIERQRKRLPNTLPDSVDKNIVGNIDNIIVKIKQKLVSNFNVNKLETKYYENLNEEIEKCKNLLDDLLPKCQIQISTYFNELQLKVSEYNEIFIQISKFQKNILDISFEIQNYIYKAESNNYNSIEISEVEMKIQEVENKISDLKQLSIDYITKIIRPEIKVKIHELKDILFFHPQYSDEIYKFIMETTVWVNNNKKDSNSIELFNEKVKGIKKFIDEIYNTKIQKFKIGEKVIYTQPKFGIISHINKDGTYDITCEDGSYYINVSYNEIKLNDNSNNGHSQISNIETFINNKKYRIGDHIKIRSKYQNKVIKSILLGINNNNSTCDVFYPPNCIERNIPLKNIQSPLIFCIKKLFKRLNKKYIFQINETVEWNSNNKDNNKGKIRGRISEIKMESNNNIFYEIITSEETKSSLTHIPYKEIVPIKNNSDKIYKINDNVILQNNGYEGIITDFYKHSKTYQITFQNGDKVNNVLTDYVKPLESINDKNVMLFNNTGYRIGDTVDSFVLINNKMKKISCKILNIYKNNTFDLCIKDDIIYKNISLFSLETTSSEFMKYEIGDEVAYRFVGSFIFYYGIIVGYNNNLYNIKSGKFYEENVPANYIRKMNHLKNNNSLSSKSTKESDLYYINNDKMCLTNGSINSKTGAVSYSFIYVPIELGNNNNNNNNIIKTIDKNIDIVFYDNTMQYEKSKIKDNNNYSYDAYDKDYSKIIRREGNPNTSSLSISNFYNINDQLESNSNCIILYKPGDLIIYYFFKKWYVGHILYYYNGAYKIQPGEKLLKQNENGIVTCESEYIRFYKDKTNQKYHKGDIVLFKVNNDKYKIGIISNYNNNNNYNLFDENNKKYENIKSSNITYCNYHYNSSKKGLNLPIYEVGDKVKARYGKEHYYNGIINRINDNGTVNILFDDGDYKENIEFGDIKFKQNKNNKSNNYSNDFVKNEKVIYKRLKHTKWRVGVINNDNENNNNKYTIVNEDGKLITNSEIEFIRKYKDYSNYIFKIGDEVKYYEYPNNLGIINKIKSNGNYDIYFKDIEIYKQDINKRRIEIINDNNLKLSIGKHVFVNYHNKNRYYDGIINKVNSDFTYNIYYNDNDYEENVKLERIRLISVDINSDNFTDNSITEQISYYTAQSDSSTTFRNSSEYFMNVSNRSPMPVHYSSFLPRKSPIFDDECKECSESEIESDHKVPSSIESPDSIEGKKVMSFPVLIDNIQIEMV